MREKILVFGVFDGVHDGHRAMLREAKKLGGFLIIAVAPDSAVIHLKGHSPKHTAAERIALLKKERIADEVVVGDTAINSWGVIKKYKPATIGLGYDQDELRQNLEEYIEKAYPEVETEEGPPEDEDGRVNWRKMPKKPRIVILSPFKPDQLHNRIIYKNK